MAAKPQGEQFPNFDLSKILGDFKMPGVDMDSLLSSQRRNIEALTQANRVAFEGMQELARRQAEILRGAMTMAADAAKDLSGPGTAQDKAARQTDLAKTAFERAISDMRDLAETAAKSQSQAFEVLNRRFGEVMEEMRASMTSLAGK